jgi:AraC-like DNA-binding protein
LHTFNLSQDAPVLQPTYIRLLCEVIQKKGIDLDTALHLAGLGNRESLQAREAMVSVQQLNAFLMSARAEGFDDRLALEVGTLLQVSAHGTLGYAVIASPNLDAALLAVERFASIRNRTNHYVYRIGPQLGVLEVHEKVNLGAARVFVTTCVAITIAQVAAAVHGGDNALQEVSLPFARPPWANALEAQIRCHCSFDAPYLCFRWNAADLRRPNSMSDPRAFGEALRTCEQQLSAFQAQPLAQRVRETLLASENHWPELQEVAAQHCISGRTLIRHLKEEGTSFQELRDTLRSQRAEFYLTQTHLSVEEVAHRLGYQDTSNFSRSFRRWFATTPRQMRESGVSVLPVP